MKTAPFLDIELWLRSIFSVRGSASEEEDNGLRVEGNPSFVACSTVAAMLYVPHYNCIDGYSFVLLLESSIGIYAFVILKCIGNEM